VRRLIGAGAGLLFKGSGFYVTDYRSAEYQAKAKAEAPPAPAASKDASAPTPPASSGKTAPKHAAKAGR
jgi:hypothetical protein